MVYRSIFILSLIYVNKNNTYNFCIEITQGNIGLKRFDDILITRMPAGLGSV